MHPDDTPTTPSTAAGLPAPVQGYIDAGNAFDLDTMTGWFAGDAVVNDARREFRGTAAIREWLARESVGDHVTVEIAGATVAGQDVTVVGILDGDYDKTGLPDPLLLSYYFTVRGDRISRLIIIRNEPTPDWAAV